MMLVKRNNIFAFRAQRVFLRGRGRGRTYHGVFHCVHQPDDVGPAAQVLQDLDLSLDLLLLDRLIPGSQSRKKKTSRDNDRRGI